MSITYPDRRAVIKTITFAIEAEALDGVLPGKKIRIDLNGNKGFYRVESALIGPKSKRSDGRHEVKAELAFLGVKQ